MEIDLGLKFRGQIESMTVTRRQMKQKKGGTFAVAALAGLTVTITIPIPNASKSPPYPEPLNFPIPFSFLKKN